MKLKHFILVIVLGMATMFVANKAKACTNIIVTRGASVDGSNMVSYAADSHWLYGELYFHPAKNWPKGAMLKVYDWDSNKYLGEIPQVQHTYKTVGNMNEYQLIIAETTFGGREELHDPNGVMDYGSLIYIALQRSKTAREAINVITSLANEYGYYSSGETFSIADKNEAWIMEVMPKGVKIVDGKNVNKGIVWVARRIPDGYICAHANQARITTFPLNDPQNCLYSQDVVSFAREMGYFSGEDKDFSFADAYAPLDFGAMRGCEARVWSAFNMASCGKFIFQGADGKLVTKMATDFLDYAMGHNPSNRLPLWIKVDSLLSVKNVADMMRDHYEGTPMDMRKDIGGGGNACPYRWRPMHFNYDGKEYTNERAIATQQTGFWFVGQARPYLPDVIGGLNWFGTDDAATSYLTPIYTSITKVPNCFKQGNGSLLKYSETASFWINNRVANDCYKMYNYMEPFVREQIDNFENNQIAKVKQIDADALALFNADVAVLTKDKAPVKKGKKAVDPSLEYYSNVGACFDNVKAFLTNYSVSTAQKQFKAWKEMEQILTVKFIDGNIKAQDKNGNFLHTKYSKDVPDSLSQPGYTDFWKEAVAKQHGKVVEVVKVNK